MLTTTTAFDTKNDETYKTPIFIISFDGETVKYLNSLKIADPSIGGYILAEDGSFSLLEDSGFIQLEGASAAPPQYLNYDNGTGGFTVGNTIIGAKSGATGKIVTVTASQLELSNISGTFLDNEIIYEASYGVELVVNGDCSVDSFTTGVGWAHDAVNNEYDATAADAARIYQTIITPGCFYKNVWTLKNYSSGSAALNLGSGANGTTQNTDDTFTELILATGSQFNIYGTGFTGSVDDISVQKITNAALANGVLTSATYSPYLVGISGLSQQITPEEGRSSIGGVEVQLLDVNDEITSLLATDTYHFHRKQTTIKVGYVGLFENSDYISIMVGWVTGLKLSNDGLVYTFSITDPQKWFQRQIFRGSEDSTVTISGNPLNILLKCITSTGAGTNGDYDVYDEANGIGLDDSFVDVAGIEAVRDDWFPGDSHYMRFSISK